MNTLFSVMIFLLLQSSKPVGIPEKPEASGIYYLQNGAHWIRLQHASIDKMKTKGMDLFVETGGYTNLGMDTIYRGAKAALRLSIAKPTFFVRAAHAPEAGAPEAGAPEAGAPEAGATKDAMLVRLSQKKDTRIFHASSADSSVENKGGFKSGATRKVAVTEYPDHSFTLTPEENLSPGEYLLVFGSGTSGFDFGIDKAK
jgi:hypothetical protein